MNAKIRIPHRDQVQMRCESLEQMLTPDHPARAVWQFVDNLDLTPWTSKIVSKRGFRDSRTPPLRRYIGPGWVQASMACSRNQISASLRE